jgi:signal transduction histidine kinase
MVNALRHTPRGGRIQVTLGPLADREGYLCVRIRDSGPGIERARQERIFEKFNAYYDLRVARTGSIGMGLAIAREIVQSHGGRIWLNSEPKKGAEFGFEIPMKRESSGLAFDLGKLAITKGETHGTRARS